MKNKKTIFHKILDHILAVLFSLIGILIVTLAGSPLNTVPLLIFIPLIVISAWNGGLSAGILTTVTSALLIVLYPFQSSSIYDYIDIAHVFVFVLFVIEGTFFSFIINLLQQRAQDRRVQKTREGVK